MTQAQSTKRNIARLAVALALAAIVGGIYFTPARAWFTVANVKGVIESLRHSWYGPLVFMLAYALGCVVAIPASIFVIAAGIIWGTLLGGIYALIGGTTGALGAYWIARFVGAGLLPKLGKHGVRAEKQMEKAGFKAMLILRLIPIFPFAVLNYAAGVARMAVGDFYLGTLVGSAPAHFVFTYSADALANGTLTGKQAFIRMGTVGLLLAAMVIIPLALKKKLEKKIA